MLAHLLFSSVLLRGEPVAWNTIEERVAPMPKARESRRSTSGPVRACKTKLSKWKTGGVNTPPPTWVLR